jgi:hypothetical protein
MRHFFLHFPLSFFLSFFFLRGGGYDVYLKCIYITSSQRALQMFIYLFEYLYSLLLLSSIFRSFLSLSFSLSSSLSLTSSFIFSPLLFFNYWYLCGKSVQLRVTNATTQNSRASFCFPPPISFWHLLATKLIRSENSLYSLEQNGSVRQRPGFDFRWRQRNIILFFSFFML